MKIVIPTSLIFFLLFVFLAALSQAEEHYIYKDANGKLVISNKQPPEGSKILRKLDLPEFRDAQMEQAPKDVSARSNGSLESLPKPVQKR